MSRKILDKPEDELSIVTPVEANGAIQEVHGGSCGSRGVLGQSPTSSDSCELRIDADPLSEGDAGIKSLLGDTRSLRRSQSLNRKTLEKPTGETVIGAPSRGAVHSLRGGLGQSPNHLESPRFESGIDAAQALKANAGIQEMLGDSRSLRRGQKVRAEIPSPIPEHVAEVAQINDLPGEVPTDNASTADWEITSSIADSDINIFAPLLSPRLDAALEEATFEIHKELAEKGKSGDKRKMHKVAVRKFRKLGILNSKNLHDTPESRWLTSGLPECLRHKILQKLNTDDVSVEDIVHLQAFLADAVDQERQGSITAVDKSE